MVQELQANQSIGSRGNSGVESAPSAATLGHAPQTAPSTQPDLHDADWTLQE